MTTKQYADGVKQSRWLPFNGRLWQRNYYEHIIRDEDELNRIRQYIADNPDRWHVDVDNPVNAAQTVETRHAVPKWNDDIAMHVDMDGSEYDT